MPVDWSVLGDIPKEYKKARRESVRERTLANLQPLPNGQLDYAGAARSLLQAGDTEGGLSLARLADAQSMRQYEMSKDTRDFGLREKQFGLQQSIATRRDEPEDVRKARAAGIDPASPEGRKALFPRTDTPISATDKKAIFEAEDAVPQLQGTVENLNRAIELNPKTLSGITAGARAVIGTQIPGGGMLVDKDAALATSEWQKIMGPEALAQMAGTLKGATTDFELRKFIEMLGDPATDPTVRKGVIERMKKLAERKLEIQQSRVKDLRGGSYFKPQGEAGASSSSSAMPRSAPPPQAVEFLRQNPDMRRQFDEKYGIGAADRFLSQ